MDFIEVELKHFSRYIKRGDIKTPNWFAIDHNILLHPDFFDVGGDEFKAFVWIVGVAAHLNNEKIRVYPDVCASQIRISPKVVKACIGKLNGKRWAVTDPLRKCTGNFGPTCTTGQDSTVQNSEVQDTAESLSRSSLTNSELKEFTFLKGISEEIQKAWVDTYPKDWVIAEIRKAWLWCLANKSKAPKKDYARFLNNWFSRGWEKHRKSLPSATTKNTGGFDV